MSKITSFDLGMTASQYLSFCQGHITINNSIPLHLESRILTTKQSIWENTSGLSRPEIHPDQRSTSNKTPILKSKYNNVAWR